MTFDEIVKNLPAYIAWTRKAIIQTLGLLGSLLSLGFLPEPYAGWVTTGIALLTIVLHFITPNGPNPTTKVVAASPAPRHAAN